MRKVLALALTGLFALSLSARAQDTPKPRTRKQAQANNGFVYHNPNVPITTEPRTRFTGGVTQAVRSGSPLQAVNPFAPASYGSGERWVRTPDNRDAGPAGLKMFVLEF